MNFTKSRIILIGGLLTFLIALTLTSGCVVEHDSGSQSIYFPEIYDMLHPEEAKEWRATQALVEANKEWEEQRALELEQNIAETTSQSQIKHELYHCQSQCFDKREYQNRDDCDQECFEEARRAGWNGQ